MKEKVLESRSNYNDTKTMKDFSWMKKNILYIIIFIPLEIFALWKRVERGYDMTVLFDIPPIALQEAIT